MVMKSYEQIRLERIQQNQKRFSQLNIGGLVQELKKPSTKAKKRKTIQNTVESVAIRKSSRNSDKPAPVYTDVIDYGIGRSTKRRSGKSRNSDLEGNFPIASRQERAAATKKANELMSSLGCPSFVKAMLHSHVNVGFWLGLPIGFCRKYFPKKDAPVILVNAEGDEFETLYLAGKVGLSAGWRGFALDHKLINGDACVFELTKANPMQFKVHLIRANNVSYGEESS